MTSFALKIIAIISMFLDHFGVAMYHKITGLNMLGRIAFPIFAFQISEGYQHTKNLKKYFLRLFIFSLVSQAPFMLLHSLYSKEITLNIFFTLFVGLIAILVYDKLVSSPKMLLKKSKKWDKIIKQLLGILVAILLGILAQVCKFDYGFFGIAIIFLFYLFRNKKIAMTLSFIIACIFKYGISILQHGYHYYYILLCLFTILSIIFILFYNGKQGKKVKYLLYFFYPVHLLVLYLLFR